MCYVSSSPVHATIIILTKQYLNIDIFSAIIISHMGFESVYTNPEVIFIDLQEGLMQ